ncbi:unnamed protein product, partial [Candidula unifasciata]
CQICSYASRNSSQLIVHLRTHTGDCPFHCTKCPAKFKINSDLKRHVRIHTGEKPFQCDRCDYKSSNKGNLKTHMKINHLEENELHCPACQFATSSRKRFREHERVHNVLVVRCTQCEYTCANFGQLRSHAIIHNSVKPFRCKLCPYSSRQSGNLKKHVQNMHLHKLRSRSKNTAVENVLLPISERSSVQRRRSTAGCRKLHSCQQCGSSFVREDSLRCHMKQHSSHVGESTIEEEADEKLLSADAGMDLQSTPTTNTATSTFYGIQQIVAAASKIYEENYGAIRATDNHPAARSKSFPSLDSLPEPSVDQSAPQSRSHAAFSNFYTPASADAKLKKKRRITALPQLPWENGFFSASVSSPYDSHLPSSLVDVPESLSSHSKTQTGNIEEASGQKLQSESAQHNSVFTQDKPIHILNQHIGKQLGPDLIKGRKIEKSFLSPMKLSSPPPSELTPLSQLPPKADCSRRQSAASIQQPVTVSLQSQPLHPLSVNPMHVQLQPTSQIQIVMSGAAVSKPGQLVGTQENSVLPQQILLQVQGSSEGSKIFTIPLASLNSLQTTGQILPHIVNHFTLQQNSLISSKVSHITESQLAGAQMLNQPALKLTDSIQNNTVTSRRVTSIPETAEDVFSNVKQLGSSG